MGVVFSYLEGGRKYTVCKSRRTVNVKTTIENKMEHHDETKFEKIIGKERGASK